MIHIYLGKRHITHTDYAEERKREKGEGRLLLAMGLRELYGIVCDECESLLSYDIHGKPFLRDCPDIYFNISHCRSAVCCAFSKSPVGIDIETLRHMGLPVLRRVMTSSELKMLSHYDSKSRAYDELCTRLWTLKESFVKYEGSGLPMLLKGIGFNIDPDDINGDIVCGGKGLYFRQYRVLDNCIMSVCSTWQAADSGINIKECRII